MHVYHSNPTSFYYRMLEASRPAVRRGRMVNRSDPDLKNALYKDLPALKERHGKRDWDVKPSGQ